jgi:hypothetical protein
MVECDLVRVDRIETKIVVSCPSFGAIPTFAVGAIWDSPKRRVTASKSVT